MLAFIRDIQKAKASKPHNPKMALIWIPRKIWTEIDRNKGKPIAAQIGRLLLICERIGERCFENRKYDMDIVSID